MERQVTILMVTHDKESLYDQNHRLKIHRFIKLPYQETEQEISQGVMEKIPVEMVCPKCAIKNSLRLVHCDGKTVYICGLCKGIWMDNQPTSAKIYNIEDYDKILNSQYI